jgi:DNA polymerase I-like protein with 3'-5' exonuclease and polymerase domains
MYKEAHAERLPDLTGGNVTKATQVQRIKRWCESEGYPMPDGLGAQLIEEALDGPNPPPDHVAEVLEIRKEMGSSSANKFKLAQDYEQDGRVHMSFVKNGATTGRYASWNFQMHNLAKLKPLEDPNVLFKKFMDIEEIDSPFRAAKSLVRALIKAPKGSKLCVADWSGIETALLFWFVDDHSTLDVLHKKGDLYRVMASEIYGGTPEDVCKDTQRPLGKALILGCGYGMGFKRFKEAAKSFGVYIELPEANLAVTKYRQKFPR